MFGIVWKKLLNGLSDWLIVYFINTTCTKSCYSRSAKPLLSLVTVGFISFHLRFLVFIKFLKCETSFVDLEKVFISFKSLKRYNICVVGTAVLKYKCTFTVLCLCSEVKLW